LDRELALAGLDSLADAMPDEDLWKKAGGNAKGDKTQWF
jgi:hypothetical protein